MLKYSCPKLYIYDDVLLVKQARSD